MIMRKIVMPVTMEQIDQIIDKEDYEGIRDQDGWETLTFTVAAAYPQLVNRILDRLQS